jgi:multiple sugar transport system permease protein
MRKKSIEASERHLAWAFILPTLIVIFLVAVYPIINTFILSLYRYNLKFPWRKKFIGFGNYARLFQNDEFWLSLKFTLKFTFVAVFIETVLGTIIALMINKPFKGRGLTRAAVLIPWAIPTVVSAMIWRMMYSNQFGIINLFLTKIGVAHSMESIQWLSSSSLAFWAIVIADVWKTTPFMALLILAGLQNIDASMYEAADVDGANSWVKFWKITLPMLKGTILVALVFRVLDSIRIFDLINVLTAGGPGNATESLSVYSYKLLMKFLDFGNGSATSMILFFIAMAFSYFFIRVLGANPYKE